MSRIITTLLLVVAVVLSTSDPALGAVGRTSGAASVSTGGAAEYSIPLWTPAGTNGLQPSLSLNYSSRGGRSPFGLGWSLSGLSVIARCGTTWQDGAPREVRNDALDRFCLDGNKLQLVSGTYGAAGAEYRTEVETFSRVRSLGAAGSGPASFTVEIKNGLIYEYGNSTDSRILPTGQTTARLWALNKIRDRSGNAVLFNYVVDTTNGSFGIDSIQYTQNAAQGVSPHYEVKFIYEALPVNDINAAYQANNLVKRVTRVNRVDVNFDGGLLRRYVLAYESALSTTSTSRLASVQECAGPTLDCVSPTTFGYQNGTAGMLPAVVTGLHISTHQMMHETFKLMDVNGDGREDLAYTSPNPGNCCIWKVAFANASGGYNTPINTGIVSPGYARAVVIDYNADGMDDLIVPHTGNTWWVMQGTTSGFAAPANTGVSSVNVSIPRVLDINGDGLQDLMWVDQSVQPHQQYYRLRVWNGTFAAAVTMTTPGADVIQYLSQPTYRSLVRAPDFNGDGRGDYMISDYYLNNPGDPDWQAVQRETAFCTGVPDCFFSIAGGTGVGQNPVPTIAHFGDFNGDGLSDALYVRDAAIRVTFSKGTRGVPEVTFPFPDQGHVAILDWDGDGRDDILYRTDAVHNWLLRRSTGESFSLPVDTGIYVAEEAYFVGVSDVNGDGLPDLLTLDDNGDLYLSLHAGVKPDLLTTVTDGFGMSSSFSYVSIIQNKYTKEASTFPLQSYIAPMYVVSQLTQSTGISSPATYTQDFWYYGARLHLQGRGLQGFAKLRAIDSRTQLQNHDEFEQTFPISGRTRRQSIYQPDGTTLISRSDYTWQTATLGSGGATRYLPYLSRGETWQYEFGGAFNAQHVRTTRRDNLVDPATGTVFDTTLTVSEGTAANGTQPGAVYTTRDYRPTANFLNDWTNWCFGRPQQAQQTASHNQFRGDSITRTANITWDALACRVTEQMEEPSIADLQVIRRQGYDAFGNVNLLTVIGAGQSRATGVYWGTQGRFPERITNALSQSDNLSWHPALGVAASHTNPNGEQTSWSLDGFGRRIGETRPDGTATTWAYNDCAADGCVNALNKTIVVERRLDRLGVLVADSKLHLDRFDRPMRASSKLLSGAYNRSDIEYDALGRVSKESAPCWVASCAQYWTIYTYDSIDRVTQVQRPRSDTDSTPQSQTILYEGLTTHVRDPLNKQSTYVRNAAGRVARSIDHDGYYQNFDYDGFGNLRDVTDSSGNLLQSIEYNLRGMRRSLVDMDTGTLMYFPNALGEVASQRDAKDQVTSFVYDPLGRMVSRSEVEGTSTFTFGTSAANHNVGRLVSVSGPSYSEGYTYDTVGRPVQKTINSDATYQVNYTYNDIGALATLTYPTSTSGYRLKLEYEYANGLLKRVKDFNAPATVFWTANDTDARGNVTAETLGNGIATSRGYDAVTGLLDYILSGPGGGGARQNSVYEWDAVGNLQSRTEANLGLTQEYDYDDLHRLTHWTVNGASPVDMEYDALGNTTIRSGIGTYNYHAIKKHQLLQAGTNTFTYDNNGNAITRNGSPITWYSYNLPRLINASGNNSSEFFYAPNRSRWKQVASYAGASEQTIYIGGLIEKVTRGSDISWKHYISGSAGFVAEHIRRSSGTNETVYLLKDHLGSVETITDATGAISARLAYGGQGPRRNGTTYGGTPSAADLTVITNTTRRGFTGHEMLDNLNLVHMNGRVYDPVVGRFISADPIVQAPTNTQSFNRYSYALNNPLKYVDPTGYAWEDDEDDGGFPDLGDIFGGPDDWATCTGSPERCARWYYIVRCLRLTGWTCPTPPPAPPSDPAPETPPPATPPTPTPPVPTPPQGNAPPAPRPVTPQPALWPPEAVVGGVGTDNGNAATRFLGAAWSAITYPLNIELTDPIPRMIMLDGGSVSGFLVMDPATGLPFTYDQPITTGEVLEYATALLPLKAPPVSAVSKAASAGKAVEGTYEILDGVRRSKAAEMAGRGTIRAEVAGTRGQIVDAPLDALRSPKAAIDATTETGLSRWLNTLHRTLDGSEPPPIYVRPGTQGTPIKDVTIDY